MNTRIASVFVAAFLTGGPAVGMAQAPRAAEWTFVLDGKTKISKAGRDVTPVDLKEGDGFRFATWSTVGRTSPRPSGPGAPPPNLAINLPKRNPRPLGLHQ
jgi:hypothetical protein